MIASSISANELMGKKVRFLVYLISLSMLVFSLKYSQNVSSFLTNLSQDELLLNLFFVFCAHLVVRELLHFCFPRPLGTLSLPRHMYYLSISSWVLAGFFAFLLHYFKYPDFSLSSHIKFFGGYVILGAGILAQLEYSTELSHLIPTKKQPKKTTFANVCNSDIIYLDICNKFTKALY